MGRLRDGWEIKWRWEIETQIAGGLRCSWEIEMSLRGDLEIVADWEVIGTFKYGWEIKRLLKD